MDSGTGAGHKNSVKPWYRLFTLVTGTRLYSEQWGQWLAIRIVGTVAGHKNSVCEALIRHKYSVCETLPWWQGLGFIQNSAAQSGHDDKRAIAFLFTTVIPEGVVLYFIRLCLKLTCFTPPPPPPPPHTPPSPPNIPSTSHCLYAWCSLHVSLALRTGWVFGLTSEQQTKEMGPSQVKLDPNATAKISNLK